jgi:hypothetical protein
VQSSGIDSVQGLSARIDAALYTFLWRRSPLAMLALAVGLRLLTEGRRSLRAVAAACTIAAIDIRLDGAVHTQTAA